MRTTLPSLYRRPLRLSSVALVGMAVLAACDKDQPVAPKVPEVPAAGAPYLGPIFTGAMVIRLVDGSNTILPIAGAGFNVEAPNKVTWTAMDVAGYDNYDKDPAAGVILRNGLAPGQYKVCEGLTPTGYGVVNSRCQTAVVTGGAATTLTFGHLPVAHVKWSVTDFGSNYISGAVFTLDTNGVVFAKVGDGTVFDGDPAGGKFDVKIPFEGYYRLCVTTAPAGYVFPANQVECVAADIKQATVTNFGSFGVDPLYSATWRVTDGSLDANSQYMLIGPSTFHVASANGLYNYDVIDNSANDFDPTLGKIAVKLLGSGYWSICETVPPVNYWNANPSCKRIDVASGVPASAGYFINDLKQVYYPGPSPVR